MRIGIDFGTSFSLPAGMINGSPATLLPGGQYGIPSVFYYDSKRNVLVGKSAEDREKFFPENIVRNVKMEISNPNKKDFVLDGKTFDKKTAGQVPHGPEGTWADRHASGIHQLDDCLFGTQTLHLPAT